MPATGRHDGPFDSHGNSASRPLLSIIIPAFNEEERLSGTLDKVAAFVGSQGFPAEVIVVDNASTDRTAEVAADFAARYSFISNLREDIRGKGAAVRTGMLAGKGDYLLISDADLSVPIAQVKEFLPPRRSDYDVAIGSREIKGAVRYNEPFHRHLMGRVFNLIVRLLVLPGLLDTQCGFKSFRRDVAHDLFAASRVNGWSFDVEVLCLAIKKGYRVIEVPVDWYYGERSKVSPVRDTWLMLKEVMDIRRSCKGGR
jgi:dolichyl-phosphate beta-glucosyltransferase